MTKFGIHLSTAVAFGDFDQAVADYIKALEAHRHTEDQPAPTAHPLVERVVLRVQYPIEDQKPDDFISNYEIIDDTPTLGERKDALADEVSRRASTAMQVITPTRKANAWAYQLSDVAAVSEKDRTTEHRTFLAQHEARQARTNAVHRHMALMHSEIEDLTEASLDDWKPAPFPE